MTHYRIGIFLLALSFSFGAPALAEDSVDKTLAQARALAATEEYDDSLATLQAAQKSYPDDPELRMAIARTLGWQRKFSQAQDELDRLSPAQRENPDARLIQGYLYYYQKDFGRADAIFSDILASYPDYADAAAGRELVQRAQQGSAEKSYDWQADFGYEYSRFTRRKQSAWNQEFVQLTHFMDGSRTAVHGKITRYDQFTNLDSEYEAGVDHAFSPRFNAYLYGAVSPNADFRPDWRVMTGGAYRAWTASDEVPALWVTLDMRRDEYEDTNALNLNPGLRVEPRDGWAVAAKAISVDQEDEKRVYGYELRLDGTLTPGWRFTAGYADAPETEAGVTVDTQSVYGAMSVDLTPAHVLRFGYARDDRENSYIRHIYNASFSYKF